MNLFLTTRRLTEAKEAHLTEFFAAVLDCDAGFRQAYACYLLGPHASLVGWSRPNIVRVETRNVESTVARGPVMHLTLEDGHVVLSEHTSDTGQDSSPRRDDESPLLECLEFAVDGVVCVRPRWQPLLPEILAHPKYIRPDDGDHFLWSDFYPLLRAATGKMATWLAEGFDLLGFIPFNPLVNGINADGLGEGIDLSAESGRVWGETRRWAESQGWRTRPGSRVELQLLDNDAASVSSVFVTLATADRLVIRATPRTVADAEAVLDSFRAVARSCMIAVEVESAPVPRSEGSVTAVKVRSRLQDVLGRDIRSVEQVEGRLLAYVMLFLTQLSVPKQHPCTVA